MTTTQSPRGLILTFAIVLLVVGGGGFALWWQQSTPLPEVTTERALFEIGRSVELPLEVAAARGTVRNVTVRLIQGDVDAVVFDDSLRAAQASVDASFSLEGKGLREGEALLEVHARDDVWRPRGPGDTPNLRIPVLIDLTPPRLDVEAATRYPRAGGAAVAVLRAEGAERVAVAVGDREFAATPRADDPKQYVSLYALPIDHPASLKPLAVAYDAAGNRSRRELPVVMREPDVRTGSVNLSHDWLKNKLPALIPDIDTSDDQALVDGFLYVSRDLRAQAAAVRDRLAAASTGPRQWDGAFVQLPNSRSTSIFGIRRTYRIDGEGLDTQVHQGFDLASTAQAPVPAANAGTVVYADDLTLYGKAVVLDHGQGLLTLYGHCSSLDVQVGDVVERGQTIAHTGDTGLAGGDHLHFEVIVGGMPVTPLQWFDAKWIRDHIDGPLEEAGAVSR